MFRLTVEEVTPVAGKKPRVVECYRQEFTTLDVLELVAKINAPARQPRVRAKTPKGAAQ